VKLYPQRINTDVSDVALQPNECRSKTIMRSGLVSGSNALSNENIQSNVLIPSEYYEENDCVIGSCEDISNDSIIFHVYNSDATKNKILRYYPFESNRVELVLKHQFLNYKVDHKITQNNVISGLFYFTDGYFNSYLNNDFNPPRKINIEKAKKFTDSYYKSQNRWDFHRVKQTQHTVAGIIYNVTSYVGTIYPYFAVGDKVVGWCLDGINRYKNSTGFGKVLNIKLYAGEYELQTNRPWQEPVGGITQKSIDGYVLPYVKDQYFGIDWQVLDRIKWQPPFPPTTEYQTDSSVRTNNLRNNLFQAAFRYIFDDNEKSVFSPISDVAIPNHIESIFGLTNPDLYYQNMLRIWYDTGSIEVKTIEIAVRNGNIGDWYIIHREEKFDQDGNVLVPNDIFHSYDFYNTEIGELLGKILPDSDETDADRVQDFVPQIVRRQELIEKNRLADSDYVEGYDNIDTDVSLTSRQIETSIGGIVDSFSTWDHRRWKEGQDVFFSKFHAGRVNLVHPIPGTTFWEPGYNYMVQVSFLPGIYNDIEYLFNGTDAQLWTSEFADFSINSFAFVDAAVGMDFKTFIDNVCVQLRSGGVSGKVIAYNNYSFKPNLHGGPFNNFWDIDLGVNAHPLTDEDLGFLIEYCGGQEGEEGGGETGSWDNCVNCKYGIVKVIKFTGSEVLQSFKSGAWHPFGWVYKDRAGRRGAVNKSNKSKLYIKSNVDYYTAHEIYKNEIDWEINHVPPPEAVYLQPVYAKNTSVDYFLFASIKSITNNSQSVAGYNNTSICINEYIVETGEFLQKFNIRAYEWQKGDRLRFVYNLKSDYTYETSCNDDVEILGVYYPDGDTGYKMDTAGGTNKDFIRDSDSNKVRNSGTIFLTVPQFNYAYWGIGVNVSVVEIYRPKKINESIVYYDYGVPLPIINPHTINRSHSGTISNQVVVNGKPTTPPIPATGTFNKGDVYISLRAMHNIFPVERFNFSDFFDSECFGIGVSNIVNPDMRRQEYISYIRYSQIFIENSLTNGLSTFYASDFDVIPAKFDNIYSTKEIGEVLRVIQKNKCHSIYIGKGEMKQPVIGDSGVVAISPSVIGSRRDHVEAYGTVFPESVVNSDNYTYFFDIYNSIYVRWATNGLQQIVYKDANTGWDYGAGVYFRNKCTALLASGIENVNVYAVFEKEYENLIVTFIDSVNPTNNETIVFHEPSNSWTMKCSFLPEYYGTNKKVLVMAKDGQLWKANAGTDRNTFFGVPYKSEIELVGHEEPDKNYVFNDIEIITNSDRWEAPNTGDIQVNLINGKMQSRLKNGRFTNREGIMVATFGKDMMTSGVESQSDLVSGRELRGHAINVRLENDSTDEVILTAININSTESE